MSVKSMGRHAMNKVDEYWDLVLTEVLIILNMCQLGNRLQLWIKHHGDMADDFKYAVQKANPYINIQSCETIFLFLLRQQLLPTLCYPSSRLFLGFQFFHILVYLVSYR